MAEEIDLEKCNFRTSEARDLDLDLGSSHTAYRRASLIDLCLQPNFNEIGQNFLWTDGRTDVGTYVPIFIYFIIY